MNLGILLSPGDSLKKQQKSGQLDRLIEYYLKAYSKEFKKIFIFSYGDYAFKIRLPQNIKLISKPFFLPYQLYLWLLPVVHRQIIKQIDVFRVFQTVGGLPLLLLTKKPFVVTYGYHYSKFAQVEKKPLKAYLMDRLITPVLKKARLIIVTSEENQQYLDKKGYQQKLKLVPNGVDPFKFKPAGKRNKMTILSVGRLTFQKNYQLLIKAVSQSAYRSDIKLTIVGQGPLASGLTKLARQLKVNLILLKPVNHSQLINYYQKAYIFVLTSKIEGQPKALLEAMSAGCACLTTSFAGNIIKDGQTGLIADSKNSLVGKLDTLLTHDLLCRQLSQKARLTILNHYNIHKLVFKEIQLLKTQS